MMEKDIGTVRYLGVVDQDPADHLIAILDDIMTRGGYDTPYQGQRPALDTTAVERGC